MAKKQMVEWCRTDRNRRNITNGKEREKKKKREEGEKCIEEAKVRIGL